LIPVSCTCCSGFRTRNLARTSGRNHMQLGSLHLRDWIIKFSDGKADANLVDQWVAIPVNRAMIHFYHPATTFFCHDAHTKVFDCKLIEKTAFDLGVITSLDLIASHDLRH
jgi:hypothetical protein